MFKIKIQKRSNESNLKFLCLGVYVDFGLNQH